MMDPNSYIGKKLLKLRRYDAEENYSNMQPLGIHLTIEGGLELLLLAVGYNAIQITKGSLEVGLQMLHRNNFEAVINDIQQDDPLNSLFGEYISNIKLAQYNSEFLEGTGFLIHQGKYAGIVVQTVAGVKFTFYQIASEPFLCEGDDCFIPELGRWTFQANNA